MKGLENAIRNLNSLDTRMVPQASAWAINRVAQKAISQATRQVARDTVVGDNQVKGIPLKLVRGRVRMLSASPAGKMYARIRVNRGNLPAIKLSTTRRRAGDGLRVGKYFFQGAFIRQLANGRWHVLKRLPEARFATGRDHQGRPKKNRLPVAVVKIPL
ncbi:TPA: phage tail protein, partial [Escherichia coli]|nr:phage tail protein [Escherichia coli]